MRFCLKGAVAASRSGILAVARMTCRFGKDRQPAFAADGPKLVSGPKLIWRVERAEAKRPVRAKTDDPQRGRKLRPAYSFTLPSIFTASLWNTAAA